MIEINIDPTMFTLGPLVISWHGFFSAFGLAIGLWLAMRLAVERRIDEAINTLALPAVIGGILGARVLFVIENWWLFADRPLAAFAINEGGISVYGAVFGGSLAAWLATRFLRPPAPDTEEGDAAPSTRSFPVAKLAGPRRSRPDLRSGAWPHRRRHQRRAPRQGCRGLPSQRLVHPSQHPGRAGRARPPGCGL